MKQSELLSAFLEQSRLNVELVRSLISVRADANPLTPVVDKLQAALDSHQQTIDRVIAHHFDRPVERNTQMSPDNAPPQMMLFDQDSSEPPSEIQRGIAALHVESDEAFLESIN